RATRAPGSSPATSPTGRTLTWDDNQSPAEDNQPSGRSYQVRASESSTTAGAGCFAASTIDLAVAGKRPCNSTSVGTPTAARSASGAVSCFTCADSAGSLPASSVSAVNSAANGRAVDRAPPRLPTASTKATPLASLPLAVNA